MGPLRESSSWQNLIPKRRSLRILRCRADSWRARASFIPELQLSLASGAMRIDFGGLDRWDHNERQRNMAELEVLQL